MTVDASMAIPGEAVAMETSQPPAAAAVAKPHLERVRHQPENPYAALIPNQEIAIVPSFTLESGVVLRNAPVAYSTRGKLSATGDNAVVICHALSGSADVTDWWGALMGGAGRAFDVSRFFVICLNSLGSPYGTASPVTSIDGDPSKPHYGPEFPLTTIRDDVNLHKIILDDLGVKQIAAVVGGSMGGMLVLEYAYFGPEYVRAIVPIATSSRHSAWGISWGEGQRQAIYADAKYEDGYYSFDDPPSTGLGAARMQALLTYRSRDSFEARFGRNVRGPPNNPQTNGTEQERPQTPSDEHFAIHNDGHKNAGHVRSHINGDATPDSLYTAQFTDPQFNGITAFSPPTPPPSKPNRPHRTPSTPYFSAQSYLRYQGQKFVNRFDSNCYIAITRKLDTHDVSKHFQDTPPPPAISITEPSEPTRMAPSATSSTTNGSNPTDHALTSALNMIQQPALVLGIESDGLFTFAEQQELATHIPNARLRKIESPEGHDAFLLQFQQVNQHILEFFREILPDIMNREVEGVEKTKGDVEADDIVGEITKTSTFGEAEVGDFTAW